jgi:3-hydroxymyristoyl/3-hydroxydecanoyl-(acyl carrier protein) dehydratase
MSIEVELKNHKQQVWRCNGTISVDGVLACSAEILFTHKDLP